MTFHLEIHIDWHQVKGFFDKENVVNIKLYYSMRDSCSSCYYYKDSQELNSKTPIFMYQKWFHSYKWILRISEQLNPKINSLYHKLYLLHS